MTGRSFLNWTAGIFSVVSMVFPAVPAATASAATILARQYVTSTVHIPGGRYTTPFVISSLNTEYILDGDITADSTAIAIRASRVVLNLNGKTITYNQVSPGEGVSVDTYNLTDIAITNGSIIQGDAQSEGDVYGAGNNPIKTKGVERLQIAGIYARYGGRDVGGFKLSAYTSILEDNTLEDIWTSGTLKNRDQGIDAITCATGNGATGNIIRNNTILNARHRGITAHGQDVIYGNTITINSLATNSFGIFGYQIKNVKVYNNRITCRGEHPIGIGFVSAGTNDIEIYNNVIDTQTTRIGEEYGGSSACFNSSTPCGNYAVGFRTTWGGNNISFHDNTITVHTDSAYQGTYSPTGQAVLVNGKGRGLMVEVNAGESSRFYNNTISVLDKDGTGKAFGIACTGGNAGDMTFEGNTVISNILNVALSDEYGACAGYPLFIKNTFVQVDNFPVYRTISAELNGYWEATGRFISNTYQGGAAENKLGMNFQYPNKNKTIIFGRLMDGAVQDASGKLLPNIGVNTYTANDVLQTKAVTTADGSVHFMVYDYELNNNNGLTQSTVPITVAFRPHVLELYDLAISQSLFKSQPDSSTTAWDAPTNSGTYTLGNSAGSITFTASASPNVPPPDSTPPTVAITSPVASSTVSGLVAINVNAADNVAVTNVELYVNGVLQGADPAPGPYTFTWNTSNVANGSYTLQAKAYDAAGNVAQSVITVQINNDKTIPTIISFVIPSTAYALAVPVSVFTASDNVQVTGYAITEGSVAPLSGSSVWSGAAPASYTFTSAGSYTLYAWAKDAAGNVSASKSAQVTITLSASSVWPATAAPATVDTIPDSAVELGVRFTADTSGYITAIRFYKTSRNTGTHVGNLWSGSGVLLASATFSSETASGWQQVNLSTPVAISANTVYIASYHTNVGYYSCDQNYFTGKGVDSPPLHALANGVSGVNGVYAYGSASSFPNLGWNSSNYWVDVVFQPATLTSIAVTPINPSVLAGTKQQFSAMGTYTGSITQQISDKVSWASSNTSTATIDGSGLVSALSPGSSIISASLNGVTGSTTLTVPVSVLSITTQSLPDATQQVSYSRVVAASGGTPPYLWSVASGSLPAGLTLNSATGTISGTPTTAGSFSFSVQAVDNSSPKQTASRAFNLVVSAAQAGVTLWPATALPATADAGPDGAVELGVKFRSEVNGYLTGVRFYKAAANNGTHVGNLWSASGSLLGSTTFSSETASGWQQANFTTPIPISANTDYVASYHTNVGHYSYTLGYFASRGVDRAPLHASANGASGANGVFAYSPQSRFPNQGWNSSNYWVDVLFQPAVPLGALSITTQSLPGASRSQSYSGTVVASGGTPPYLWSIVNGTLPAGLTLNSATGAISGIPTTVGSFSFSVQAADAGSPMQAASKLLSLEVAAAPANVSLWGATTLPEIPDTGPDSPVELGVKFRSDVNGYITSIRFYKAATNTGTHVGNLWTASGTLLASATFTNETPSGWQQVALSPPVAISANTEYTVSYHTNVGHYSDTPGYFLGQKVDSPPLHAPGDGQSGPDGVYIYGSGSSFPSQGWYGSNYWVDVVFQAADAVPMMPD